MTGTQPIAGGGPVRVAILWQGLSGYSHAAFRALSERGVDVLVFHSAQAADAPFDPDAITHGLRTHAWQGQPDPDDVEAALAAFDPHVLLVSSWHIPAYRRAARRRRGQTLRVLCMDNQWWATPKQMLGVGTSPLLVRPTYDAAFVPGERSADFARRLGFPDERIIRGIYSCDHPRFDAVAEARGDAAPAPAFVFVGRLVAEKGIDVLAEGYRRYRQLTDRTVAAPRRGGRARGRQAGGRPGCRHARLRAAGRPPGAAGPVRVPGPAQPVRALGRGGARGDRRRAAGGVHPRLRGGEPAGARRLQRGGRVAGRRRGPRPRAAAHVGVG